MGNKQVFKRSPQNPILEPKPENPWEAKKLYNPGAVIDNGKIHLYYRAIGEGEDWSSAIGYAVSDIKDGEKFLAFINKDQ